MSSRDSDFVIMARTDALAVHGIEEAIERMSIYREVGADLLFVEAPENEIQMKRTTFVAAKVAHLAEPVRPGGVALEVQGGAGSQDVADFNLLGMDGNGGAQHEEGH